MTRLYYVLILVFLLASSGAHAAVSPRAGGLDSIVAVVNDDVITRTELETRLNAIKQQLQQRNTRLPPDEIIRRQVLERMIQQQLQLQMASRSGVRVDDETVNGVMANIARENNLSLTQFREALEQQGYVYADFRENIRNEIIIDRLRKQRVESRVTVTEKEVENQLKSTAQQAEAGSEYHLGHILVAIPEAASPEAIEKARVRAEAILDELRAGADFAETAVARSDGQQALQGGDLGWRKAGELPTLFDDSMAKLAIGQVSELLRSPSGFHIVKLIDKRESSQRRVIQQTLARHVLIITTEVVSDTTAQKRLSEIRQQILKGSDFGQMARVHSDDKTSAANGGSLGWTSAEELVPEFQKVMDTLQPGQLSEPFRTRYGWHIVQVMSRRQQDETENFERLQARRLVMQRKVQEAVENWLRQLRDEAYVENRLTQ
jgi:peptidyl-prolyl cis-trans isomerase SurA